MSGRGETPHQHEPGGPPDDRSGNRIVKNGPDNETNGPGEVPDRRPGGHPGETRTAPQDAPDTTLTAAPAGTDTGDDAGEDTNRDPVAASDRDTGDTAGDTTRDAGTPGERPTTAKTPASDPTATPDATPDATGTGGGGDDDAVAGRAAAGGADGAGSGSSVPEAPEPEAATGPGASTRSGDARNADARSGDARSGDARNADARNADAGDAPAGDGGSTGEAGVPGAASRTAPGAARAPEPGEPDGQEATAVLRVPGGGGSGPDEDDLRQLFHGAVQGIRPADGTLDHLRRAVPARRARKRQLTIGAAAAAVLLGTGLPAFVHVADSGGSEDTRTVNTGHGRTSEGGTGIEPEESASRGATSGPTKAPAKPEQPPAAKPPSHTSGSAKDTRGPTGPSTRTTPPAAADPGAPECTSGQLAVTAETGGPDGEGKVQGAFKVTNVSSDACLITSPGVVSFVPDGAADSASIGIAGYSAGDGSGIPAVAEQSGTLVLTGSSGYEVRFAWVPNAPCPTGGGVTPEPSGDPGTPSGGTDASGGGTETGGTQPQLGASEVNALPAEGQVTVTYAAPPGDPATTATIPDACAGIIYHTGIVSG
jgi:hypothetical protein